MKEELNVLLYSYILKEFPTVAPLLKSAIESNSNKTLPSVHSWQGVQLKNSLTEALSRGQHSPSLDELLRELLRCRSNDFATNFCSILDSRNLTRTLPKYRLSFLRNVNTRKVTGLKAIKGSIDFRQSFRTFCHLAPIYCVIFDRTGQYIFTGADDHKLKAWCAASGRLLFTFRGHTGEVSDISISPDNRLLISGGYDSYVRVWLLSNGENLCAMKCNSEIQYADVSPGEYQNSTEGPIRYIVALCNSNPHFFKWVDFSATSVGRIIEKPIKFIEVDKPRRKACWMSWSRGGAMLVSGSEDNVVRIYSFVTSYPQKLAEIEGHKSGITDALFANFDCRFLTGSEDCDMYVFKFCAGVYTKKYLKPPIAFAKKLLYYVAWSCDDQYVIAIYRVEQKGSFVWVFNANTCQPHVELKGGHSKDVMRVLTLPLSSGNPYIAVTGGSDLAFVVWNLHTGAILSRIALQSTPLPGLNECSGILDMNMNDEGTHIAATDAHSLIVISLTSPNRIKRPAPVEQNFFHTDFRPFTLDERGLAVDCVTALHTHLNPPPWLIDSDSHPYSCEIQRLVPGRSRITKSDLLQPRITLDDEGYHIVCDDAVGAHKDVVLPSNWLYRNIIPPLEPQEVDRYYARQAKLFKSELMEYAEESRGSLTSVDATVEVVSNRLRKKALYDTESSCSEWECDQDSNFRPPESQNANDRAARRKKYEQKRREMQRQLEEEEAKRRRQKQRKRKRETTFRDESDVDLGSSPPKTRQEAATRNPPKKRRIRPARVVLMSESSDEETAGTGKAVETPKISAMVKKPVRVKGIESEDDEEVAAEDQPCCSNSLPPSQEQPPHSSDDDEENGIEEDENDKFQPPEWFTSTTSLRSPFLPQLGDEIAYFPQGHELYDARPHSLRKSRMYRDAASPVEYFKVKNVKFGVKPPHFCSLKLEPIKSSIRCYGSGDIDLKYADLPDVIDFLTLKQWYDYAIEKQWSIGDRFRAKVDGEYYEGKIIDWKPYELDGYDWSRWSESSLFMCFEVQWDTGDREELSPWDLEPISENERNISSTYIAKRIEKVLTEIERKRIMDCLERLVAFECSIESKSDVDDDSIAISDVLQPFQFSVDFSIYPIYPRIIAYPIYLERILERLKNSYYRRIASLQFDIRYIEKNALLFNEPSSMIGQAARLLTRFLLTKVLENPRMNSENIFDVCEDFLLQSSSQPVVDDDGVGSDQDEQVATMLPRRSARRDAAIAALSSGDDGPSTSASRRVASATHRTRSTLFQRTQPSRR